MGCYRKWDAVAKRCKANGICVRYRGNRQTIAELRKLLNGVGSGSPAPRMRLSRIVQRCRARGIQTSDKGGLLPKKFLHALLSMPPKVKDRKRTLNALEVCSRAGQIAEVARQSQ